MKKVLATLMVMFAVITASAQDMYLGGGIGIWANTDTDNTNFSITPDFRYGLNDKWAVGGGLTLDITGGNGSTSTAFAINPYARWTYWNNGAVSLFLDMGFGVSVNKTKHVDAEAGFELGVRPGVAIELNDKFSVFTKIGFAGFRTDYLGNGNRNTGVGVYGDGNGLSFGIEYAF